MLTSEPGVSVPWRYFPARGGKPGQVRWLVVLDEEEALAAKPDWLAKAVGDEAVLLVAPRGSGPSRWPDPAPYYIHRSLPLLGRTADSCQLADALAAAAQVLNGESGVKWRAIGRHKAGVIAGYVALLEPRLSGVTAVDPPATHRDGPIFLNVLRVFDVPEALGLLAPRPLRLVTSQAAAFDHTRRLYGLAGGSLDLEAAP